MHVRLEKQGLMDADYDVIDKGSGQKWMLIDTKGGAIFPPMLPVVLFAHSLTDADTLRANARQASSAAGSSTTSSTEQRCSSDRFLSGSCYVLGACLLEATSSGQGLHEPACAGCPLFFVQGQEESEVLGAAAIDADDDFDRTYHQAS